MVELKINEKNSQCSVPDFPFTLLCTTELMKVVYYNLQYDYCTNLLPACLDSNSLSKVSFGLIDNILPFLVFVFGNVRKNCSTDGTADELLFVSRNSVTDIYRNFILSPESVVHRIPYQHFLNAIRGVLFEVFAKSLPVSTFWWSKKLRYWVVYNFTGIRKDNILFRMLSECDSTLEKKNNIKFQKWVEILGYFGTHFKMGLQSQFDNIWL